MVESENTSKDIKAYLKIFLVLELCAALFLGLFYYSCGKQLYERESDGNIEEFAATNDVGELVSGNVIEQYYTSEMDKLTRIGVMASNYGQPFDSHLYIKCENVTQNYVIAEGSFPVSELGINQYVYLDGPEYPEDVKDSEFWRGDVVKVTITSDGDYGNAPTVLYSLNEAAIENLNAVKDAKLVINGVETAGNLCIAMEGTNYVWTGPHYWMLALGALVLLAAIYWVLALCDRKGKKVFFFTLMGVYQKYRFLIRQLVSRDFKTRYKRSILGVFWSFLNPLLLMLVQYIVFSQLFKMNIDNFPVYLLTGTVVFNFFTEGVSQSLTSIVGNAPLITKVYLPKYVYPVTRVLSSGINLLMSLIPLVIVSLATGEHITKAYWMAPYILLCVIVFTTGFGMVMASAMTFFRDMQFLWGVLSMIWTYLTPLFYPVEIVARESRDLFQLNPMYHFVTAMRDIIMEGITPRPGEFVVCTALALGMLLIGGLVFKKTQDKFVFYL